MSRRLIVFATKAEADASLQLLKARELHEQLYAFADGLIAISGIGLHAAQMAVSRHSHQVEEIWNLGIAGALNEGLQLGKRVEVKRIGKYLPHPTLDAQSERLVRASLPELPLLQGEATLISSDFPVHDRNRLNESWDLVDMEGYGIAYAARALGKKCRIWKIVSDFAQPGGHELIKTHLAEHARQLAEILNESCPHP